MTCVTYGSSLLTDELVTIYVGPKRKKYTVHKEILCRKSKYFNSALKTGFKEAINREFYFNDRDPGVFDDLVRWIYQSALRGSKKPRKHRGGSLEDFLGLYFIGDEFYIEELKNEVMDAVRASDTVQDLPKGIAISSAYDNTPAGDPMRRYLAEHVASLLVDDMLLLPEHIATEIRKGGDLAVDLAFALQKASRPDFVKPSDLPKCDFHVHIDSEKCTVE